VSAISYALCRLGGQTRGPIIVHHSTRDPGLDTALLLRERRARRAARHFGQMNRNAQILSVKWREKE
jgi:hypothetical protein